MSGSALGSLTVIDETGADLFTLDFINLNFPDGWVWDVSQRVVVPVNGMGVNNTRMRLIRDDFPRFRIDGHSLYSTFDGAVSAGNSMKGYKGYRGTIQFNAAGVNYTFPDVFYIWEIGCFPVRAETITTAATTDSGGAILRTLIEAQFVLAAS